MRLLHMCDEWILIFSTQQLNCKIPTSLSNSHGASYSTNNLDRPGQSETLKLEPPVSDAIKPLIHKLVHIHVWLNRIWELGGE